VSRVTGGVCGKIAQNVAQHIFCPNLRIEKEAQKCALNLQIKKLLKLSNRPLDEYSPNLVTLTVSKSIILHIEEEFIQYLPAL
jgi:hypothetical protein